MDDENKSFSGWWTNKKFSAVGTSHFDCNWGAQAMAEQALATGATVLDNQMEGILKGTLEEVIKGYQDLGGRILLRCPPWRGDKGERMFMVWPNGVVGMWIDGDGDLEIRFVCTDPELFAKGQALAEKHIGPKASAGRVYVLIQTDEGPKLQSIGVASVPLEPENYNPEVVEGFNFVVEDLKSLSPSGRLAILDGRPGTGKTFLIRALLHAVPNALFVVVPAHLIPELANPGMISALLETKKNKGDNPTVFIVEDADDCLVARDSSNVNAVSALLNLGDGLLGAMMELRIVCTTNAKTEELDEAVTRPGRLSRKISVEALEPKAAKALYEKLTGKTMIFGEAMTLAEVYRLARGEGWKPVKRSRTMGFSTSTPEDSLLAALLDE